MQSTQPPNYVPKPPKDKGVALILEILPGLFGFLGIGWIYSGETSTGILFLVGMIMWNIFAAVIVGLTLGIACLCTFPINILLIAVSTVRLNKHIENHPELFGVPYSLQSAPTMPPQPAIGANITPPTGSDIAHNVQDSNTDIEKKANHAEAIGELTDSVQDGADKATEAIADTSDSVAEATTDAIDSSAEAVSDTADDAADAASDVVDEVTDSDK